MRNKPFVVPGGVGILVILTSLVLLAVFPSKATRLPEGFFTPIIAFEFIETGAETHAMFTAADGTVRRELTAAMDLGNRLDFAYMILYGLFLALFCAKCAALSGKKCYHAGVLLAAGVVLADGFENIQLLSITAHLDAGGLGHYVSRLRTFAWMKWGGICVIFLLLVPWFRSGGRFSKSISLLAVLTAVLGGAAFLRRSVVNEVFALCVGIMFVLMIIYCFVYRNPGDDKSWR